MEETKEGYKYVKVIGWVPIEWEIKKVGEHVQFEGGSQPPKEYFKYKQVQNYIRLIQIRDYKTDEYATYIPKNMAKRFCKTDDIMIGRYGPPIFQILRGLEGAYNVALMKAIPDNAIYKEFLYYFLQQETLFKLIDRLSRRSSGQTGVDKNALENYILLLPTYLEQQKIALILSTLDKFIANIETQIEEKKMYRKELIKKLITDNMRLKNFKDIKLKQFRLEEVLTPVVRAVEKPNDSYEAIGIRSYGKGTFDKFVEDPSKVAMDILYEVKENDLIINITFAWEGAIAIVKKLDEGKLVSHRFPTYEFNKELAIPEYFKYVIIQPSFTYLLDLISPGGAGRNRVMSKKDFLKLKVKLPSVEEQKVKADILNTADKEIELLEQKLEELKIQKKVLMQKLLTGKIRVKV